LAGELISAVPAGGLINRFYTSATLLGDEEYAEAALYAAPKGVADLIRNTVNKGEKISPTGVRMPFSLNLWERAVSLAGFTSAREAMWSNNKASMFRAREQVSAVVERRRRMAARALDELVHDRLMNEGDEQIAAVTQKFVERINSMASLYNDQDFLIFAEDIKRAMGKIDNLTVRNVVAGVAPELGGGSPNYVPGVLQGLEAADTYPEGYLEGQYEDQQE
jgi:hypothetical protein